MRGCRQGWHCGLDGEDKARVASRHGSGSCETAMDWAEPGCCPGPGPSGVCLGSWSEPKFALDSANHVRWNAAFWASPNGSCRIPPASHCSHTLVGWPGVAPHPNTSWWCSMSSVLLCPSPLPWPLCFCFKKSKISARAPPPSVLGVD